MTVNTVSPAIISRAEFNLNAGQTKTPQLVRMDFGNLVTNGTFDTDTDWTKGTGWTIAAGVASKAAGTGSEIEQGVLVVGRHYVATQNMTARTAGGTFAYFGSTLSAQFENNITSSVSGTATTSSRAGIFASSLFDGSVDDVSFYEADPSDDAPWLSLPYGYSVGRTGMIVRDGVVLHPSDYTEVKDSGQTWIKPIVAPGVSTEFSIWGSPSYAV